MSFFGGILDSAASFLGISSEESKPKKQTVDLGFGPQVVDEQTKSDAKKTSAAKTNTSFDPLSVRATADSGRYTALFPNQNAATSGNDNTQKRDINAILKATIADAEKSIRVTPRPTPINDQDLNGARPPTGTGQILDRQPSTSAIPPIQIYDSAQPQPDGSAAYIGDSSTINNSGRNNAIWAATNVQRGLQYFQSTFGRNGLDGQGSTVQVVVNDQSTGADGAELFHGNGGFYVTDDASGKKHEALRFGSGTTYQHANGGTVSQYEMEVAPDLMIHEMTHGVIYHEVGSLGGTHDEAGSVNEALADVMAAAATRDWRIGEALYTPQSDYKQLRNIANPNDPSAVHALWSNISEYRQAEASGSVEEHFASGILSQAAYRIQQNIGWDETEHLFYNTITGGKLANLSFAETAAAIRSTSVGMWGVGSYQSRVVDNELRAAGL